jgi:hypothetical protein
MPENEVSDHSKPADNTNPEKKDLIQGKTTKNALENLVRHKLFACKKCNVQFNKICDLNLHMKSSHVKKLANKVEKINRVKKIAITMKKDPNSIKKYTDSTKSTNPRPLEETSEDPDNIIADIFRNKTPFKTHDDMVSSLDNNQVKLIKIEYNKAKEPVRLKRNDNYDKIGAKETATDTTTNHVNISDNDSIIHSSTLGDLKRRGVRDSWTRDHAASTVIKGTTLGAGSTRSGVADKEDDGPGVHNS